MSLWFVLALMTVAAVLAVLWPLSRPARGRAGGMDAAVYEQQLRTLARERKVGLIGEGEAENLRAEIGRRLLAATDQADRAEERGAASVRRRRIVLVAAITVLPLAALSAYLTLGSPNLRGAPLTARLAPTPDTAPINELVTRVEAHLERNPEDGRGWEVLAPVYASLNRFEDAVKARRNALRLNGANAQREADLGEALAAAANGVITADAKAAFQRALTHDATGAKARYYLGLASEQDGSTEEAITAWRALLAETTPQTPWAGAVRQALARVDPGAQERGPSSADIAAAESLNPEQRKDMIRGMVEGLAKRLREESGDVDGWVRLIRSYMVLDEAEKARRAAADARRSMAGDEGKLRRIDDLARSLGLES